jgi:hypothetical protein
MGLENLSTIFNDISENQLPDYGGPHGHGVHGGLTNERPSTPPHPEWHSTLDDLIEIGRVERLQDPSPLMGEDKLTHYSSFITGNKISPQLGYSGEFDVEVTNPTLISIENKQNRRNDLFKNTGTFVEDLGKSKRLGYGQFVFESLYKKEHKAVTNRTNIEVKPSSVHEGYDINLNRAGMGNLNQLDIKANSTSFNIQEIP